MLRDGDGTEVWCAQLRRMLVVGLPAGQAVCVLRCLVSWLDRTVPPEPGSVQVQALTRMIAAAGRLLLAGLPGLAGEGVSRTVVAAEAYASEPGEDSFVAYFEAATGSYPYGAGDGCLSMDSGAGCGPGTGCRTGAGTLWQIAATVGAGAVLDAVTRAVVPWLPGGLQSPAG